MDNNKLYEAAMLIKEYCTDNDCYECVFGTDFGGCLISPKDSIVPEEWRLKKTIRWTDEDVALAKALKVFGVKEIYNGVSVYPPKRWAIDTDEGVLPQRAFANLSSGERISIDDIIKAADG